ncbi:PE PGRS family protein [Mycobacterium tuberculosis]|nr:PE PGRS family protein [Mycobacterium tuberculosis]
MAVSPVTGLVFVTNFDSNTVSVIDPNTNTVTGSIPVGTGAYGVAVNPGANIYVTNQGSNTVSVIDPVPTPSPAPPSPSDSTRQGWRSTPSPAWSTSLTLSTTRCR